MYIQDTIAAIATPPGEGGIAIVRISGPNSLAIADKVFKGKGPKPSQQPSHTILHGYIYDDDGFVIDEVILLIMRAPKSYTCEDVVEIQGHGGTVLAGRILRRVLSEGARLSEPGEFTKRAFLNGRLDLVQAEAVLDLIKAKTERAASVAADQLAGHTSRFLSTCYDRILAVLRDMEATLDFPEDDLPNTVCEDLVLRITNEISNLQNIKSSSSEGRLLRDGAKIVITGKPNVGKSTLFNALVGKERAIVSVHPGTTRDTVEDWISIEGVPFSVVDTAGIRETACEIEQEGVRRARESLESADLIIHIFDLSSEFDRYDAQQISLIRSGKSLIVLNKSDLPRRFDAEKLPKEIQKVEASMKYHRGFQEISEKIVGMLGISKETHLPRIAISERHRALVEKSENELKSALHVLKESGLLAADIAAHHVRAAIASIAEILGKSYTDDLLDSIFSKFCIGK